MAAAGGAAAVGAAEAPLRRSTRSRAALAPAASAPAAPAPVAAATGSRRHQQRVTHALVAAAAAAFLQPPPPPHPPLPPLPPRPPPPLRPPRMPMPTGAAARALLSPSTSMLVPLLVPRDRAAHRKSTFLSRLAAIGEEAGSSDDAGDAPSAPGVPVGVTGAPSAKRQRGAGRGGGGGRGGSGGGATRGERRQPLAPRPVSQPASRAAAPRAVTHCGAMPSHDGSDADAEADNDGGGGRGGGGGGDDSDESELAYRVLLRPPSAGVAPHTAVFSGGCERRGIVAILPPAAGSGARPTTRLTLPPAPPRETATTPAWCAAK